MAEEPRNHPYSADIQEPSLLTRADAAIATSRQLRDERRAMMLASTDWLTRHSGRLRNERHGRLNAPPEGSHEGGGATAAQRAELEQRIAAAATPADNVVPFVPRHIR